MTFKLCLFTFDGYSVVFLRRTIGFRNHIIAYKHNEYDMTVKYNLIHNNNKLFVEMKNLKNE